MRGLSFAGVPAVFYSFNPRNGSFVIAFYATVVALWIAMFYRCSFEVAHKISLRTQDC